MKPIPSISEARHGTAPQCGHLPYALIPAQENDCAPADQIASLPEDSVPSLSRTLHRSWIVEAPVHPLDISGKIEDGST